MGVQDVLNFDFISPPSEAILQEAFKELVLLEAIETVENQKVLIYLFIIDFTNYFYKIIAFFIHVNYFCKTFSPHCNRVP